MKIRITADETVVAESVPFENNGKPDRGVLKNLSEVQIIALRLMDDVRSGAIKRFVYEGVE